MSGQRERRNSRYCDWIGSRNTEPKKICPVCELETDVRYWNDVIKSWVYKHKKHYEETIYHHAKS